MKKRDEICFNNTDPLKAIFLVLRFAVEYYSQANLKTHQRRLIKKEKFCSKRLSLFLLFPIQFLLLFSSLQIYKQYQKSHQLISFNFFKFSHSPLIQNTNMMMLRKKRSELNLFGEESFVGHMPISLTSYWISCFWSISLILFFLGRFSLFLHHLSNLCFKAFFDY